jgi:autotransporter translocation and assembly factor TamB
MHRFTHATKLIILWLVAVPLAVAVFIFAVSIAFYHILTLPSVQERALRMAEGEIASRGYLNGDITIERLESNLISYVNIYGLRAVGKSGYGDSVYVGRVSVRYWLPPLLRKKVSVRKAVVTDVRGHIVMAPDGNVMFPFIPVKYYKDRAASLGAAKKGGGCKEPPDPSEWAWKVELGRARVSGLNGVYRDLRNNMLGEIINAEADARFHAVDSFSAVLRVPEGSYVSPWWSGAIDTVGASAVVTWHNLEVRSLLLRGAATRVTAAGKLSYCEGKPWDLRTDFITSISPLPVLYENAEGLGKAGILEGTASFGGTLYEPVFGARVKGYGIDYRGYGITSLEVDASYGRDEYGRARVRGGSAFGSFDIDAKLRMKNLMRDPNFGDYSATALLGGLDAKGIAEEFKIKLPLPIDSGRIRVKADGKCFELPEQATLAAEFAGENLADGVIGVNARLQNGAWELDGNWGANGVGARGKLDFKTLAVKGSLEADISDPATPAAVFTKERPQGKLELAAEFGGRLDAVEKFAVSATVRGDGIRWRGIRADSLEALLSVDSGKLRLQRADGRVHGRVDSVAAYFGQGGKISGYIDADVSMKGGLDDPLINTRLHGYDLRYGEYAVDTLSGFASMEKDTVRWNNLYLRGMGTILESGGRLTVGPDITLSGGVELFDERQGGTRVPAGRLVASGTVAADSVKGSFRLTSLPLRMLDPWLPPEHRVLGIFSLSGDFSGTAANPGGKVSFKLVEPAYGKYGVHSVSGDASLCDSMLTAVAVVMASGTSNPIELKALLPLLPSSGWKIDETGNRSARVSASAGQFDLSELSSRFLEPAGVVTGAAAFDVKLLNDGGGWNIGGELAIPDAAVRYEPLDASVNGIGLKVGLSGTPQTPRAAFTLFAERTEIGQFSIDRCFIKGRSGIDTLALDSARFVLRDSGAVELKGMLRYGGLDSLLYNQNFYAQYRIKSLPVSALSRLMPGVRLRNGVFNGSGLIYAANGRPLLEGTLRLAGLNIVSPDITPSIGPLDASLRFSDSTITVASLNARWGGRGSISASGRTAWNLENLFGVNLSVSGQNIAFELPEVVNVGVTSADLQISDRGGGIVIDGRVAMGPTNYVRDLNIVDLINQMQVAADVRRTPHPFLESIRLRVDLDLANNVGIDMNFGTLLTDGRLTVAGTAGSPGIVGEIKIVDGFVYYLDRKFTIAEGVIFNPDHSRLNPTLKLTAKADVITFSPDARSEQFTITLNVTGTMDNPVVRFVAEPALSELDILSILTFGERMGGMGSDINNRLMNIAAQQAIGLGTRRLEKLLNLDRVSVSGDVLGTGNSQSAGATIGVSKRFTSRLNVTYETNTNNLSDRKVTAQYRLLQNLFLEGLTGSDGENALDLILRYSR